MDTGLVFDFITLILVSCYALRLLYVIQVENNSLSQGLKDLRPDGLRSKVHNPSNTSPNLRPTLS